MLLSFLLRKFENRSWMFSTAECNNYYCFGWGVKVHSMSGLESPYMDNSINKAHSAWHHNYVWNKIRAGTCTFWPAGRRWFCNNSSTRVWQLHPPPRDSAAVMEGGHWQLTSEVHDVWMPISGSRVSSSSVCEVTLIRIWGWLATFWHLAAMKDI